MAAASKKEICDHNILFHVVISRNYCWEITAKAGDMQVHSTSSIAIVL